MEVYHFTDTLRLPWIVHSGGLAPVMPKFVGFPTDVLWATKTEVGDRTAAISSTANRNAYKQGLIRLVRFTLSGHDFAPWRNVLEALPDWTDEHIARLEMEAINKQECEQWCARAEALPMERVLRVDTRAYHGSWTLLEDPVSACTCSGANDGACGTAVIGRVMYGATLKIWPGGVRGYTNVTAVPLHGQHAASFEHPRAVELDDYMRTFRVKKKKNSSQPKREPPA